jgi:hypothetical protein
MNRSPEHLHAPSGAGGSGRSTGVHRNGSVGLSLIAAVTNSPPPTISAAPTDATSVSISVPRRGLIRQRAAVATLTAVAAIGWLVWVSLPSVPQRAAVEFTVSEPDQGVFSTEGNMLALSPDGSHLAFIASDANGSSWLWVRPLDSVVPRLLAGTNGASNRFGPQIAHAGVLQTAGSRRLTW